MTFARPTDRPAPCRDERGFTLPELLVAIMLTLLIVGAAVGTLAASQKTQPRLTERSTALQQGRALIDRVGRELRQSYGVPSPTPTASTLSILTYVKRTACGGSVVGPARQCKVTYSCSGGICTRTERNPDGTGSAPAVRVAEGLLSNSVFSYQPSATSASYVGIRLEYPGPDGAEAVTVSDGVALRNVPMPAP